MINFTEENLNGKLHFLCRVILTIHESFLSLKTIAPSVRVVLFLDNGDTKTNIYDITNTYNNYFATIPETTKNHKKYTLNFSRLSYE